MNAETIKLNTIDDILVSIVIATYNAQQHISSCLSSILSQTQKRIEIVIVDGGSTDDTVPIIKKINNALITLVSEPDNGIYHALNKGIALAKGKWIYFMGSDDLLLPGFSELTSKLKNENTLYYGNTDSYYTGNKPSFVVLSGKFSRYRLAKYCINHQAIIYPAQVFKKYRYDLQYKVFADYALNIKVWGDADFKRVYYPVTIAKYNMNGFSSLSKDALFIKDKPSLIRLHMGWLLYLRFLYKRYKKKLLNEKGFE